MRLSVPTVIVDPRKLWREGMASLLRSSKFRVIDSEAAVDKLRQFASRISGLLIIKATALTRPTGQRPVRSDPLPARPAVCDHCREFIRSGAAAGR